MFNGRSTTRKVDMRGADQGVSRDANLKRVREAREQRQKELRHQQSATKIQSVYRGYAERKLFWFGLERACLAKPDPSASKDGGGTAIVDAIRRFHFLKSNKKSQARFHSATLVRVFASDAQAAGAQLKTSPILSNTFLELLVPVLKRKLFPNATTAPAPSDDAADPPASSWDWKTVVLDRLFVMDYGGNQKAVKTIANLVAFVGEKFRACDGTQGTDIIAAPAADSGSQQGRTLSALVWKVTRDQHKSSGSAEVAASIPDCLTQALLSWDPLLGVSAQKLATATEGSADDMPTSRAASFGTASGPSYTKTLLGSHVGVDGITSSIEDKVESALRAAVLSSTQGGGATAGCLNSLSTILQCEPELHLHTSQIYKLITGACAAGGGVGVRIPGMDVVSQALGAVKYLKEEEERVVTMQQTPNGSPTTPGNCSSEGRGLMQPRLLRLYSKKTVHGLFLHALGNCTQQQQSTEQQEVYLGKLNEVCGIYIEPWMQFCSQQFYGSQERRRTAFPLLSFFAEQKQLMLALWQVLKDLHKHWACNDGAGLLVIRYPKLVLLFLTVFTSTFASGTGDIAQLFGLAAAEKLKSGAPAVAGGGSASSPATEEGAACPLPLEEVRALVRMMRDHVFRSHMNGCSTDDATKAVAQAAYQLLAKLHSVDESLHFLNGTDWCVTEYQYPMAPLTMEQWREVRGSIVQTVDVDGTSTTAAAAPVAEAPPEDSDSDDDDWADPLQMLRGAGQRNNNYAQAPRRRQNMLAGSSTKPLKEFDSRSPPYARVGQLLLHCPFVVPFTTRLQLVGGLMISERERNQGVFWNEDDEVKVRRSDLFQDAFEKLGKWSTSKLRGRLPVRFVGEDGEMEAGFGDGVVREFMMEVCRNGFAGNSSLFIEGPNGLYPRPHSQYFLGNEHLSKFSFLGKLVGKALKEGILLDIPFARFFRNALIGRTNGLSEMPSYDAEQYRHLVHLQSLDAATIRELCLTFSVTVEVLGTTTELPLMQGGKDIEVTYSNLQQYIHLMADFRLNREAKHQVESFKRGFFEMVDQSWFAVFDSNEVQTLLQGAEDDVGLDLLDWKEHTVYGQGYSAAHPTIQSFWRVLENCTPAEQRSVLQFVTSVKRAPLLGFRHMTPQFSIARGGTDMTRLPTAATCMCLLKLPEYLGDSMMRDKLLKAAHDGATFELS